MTVADLKKRPFYKNRIEDGCSRHQFLVIEVAAMDPRWGAVPATGFFWRRDAETAEKRMQGNIDAVGPMGNHFLCVERNDPHLPVEDLVRHKAGVDAANGIIAVRDRQID